MVIFGAVRCDYDSLQWSEQVAPEAGELLWRFGPDERAERDGCSPSRGIDGHEVDGVGRREQAGAVAGYPVSGTVLDEPAACEWVFEVEGSSDIRILSTIRPIRLAFGSVCCVQR